MGGIRANDFPRQANESGRAGGDHPSVRTDPDDAERDTGTYGSQGLRALAAAPLACKSQWSQTPSDAH